MLIPINPDRPRADQIYLFLRTAILEGRLAPGERLPSSRRLRQDLNVARNTIMAVYDRLRAEGYVSTDGARGTRVSATIPRGRTPRPDPPPRRERSRTTRPRLSAYARRVRRASDVFPPAARRLRPLRWDFQYNVNVSDRASRRAWHRILRRHAARHESAPSPYNLTNVPEPLTREVARHLELTRGLRCAPDQVILVNSIQQAFQLTARMLLDPGDTIAMEDPHRVGARNAFLAQGLKVRPLRTDDQGLRPDSLPEKRGIRMVYVSPSHLWPRGAVLPTSRRLELLDWADRHGAWILENDHNSEYSNWRTPVVSLQGLDHRDRVLYVGTFSRLISPEPEISYVVVPPALVGVFRDSKALESYWCPALETSVLAEYLADGELEALHRRVIRRLKPLRACLHDALGAIPDPGIRVSPNPAGLQTHVEIDGYPVNRVDDLVDRCVEAEVGVFPDAPYYLRRPRHTGLVFGFARLAPDEIAAGVEQFGRVLRRARRDVSRRGGFV